MNKKFLGKGKKNKEVLGIIDGSQVRLAVTVDENFKSNKGCVGRRIKIQPEKSDIIGQEELIQRGKVIGVGPQVVNCKVGDTIIYSNDGFEPVKIGDESFYYILDIDTFVYEVL